MQTDNLPKTYDPSGVEDKWYARWTEAGYFHAEPDSSRPRYSITIPPPNVTGSLHIGHALCYSIHDVLVRWKRMQGYNTLCLPGTDHAGIATQKKVADKLAKEGIDRLAIGREAFLEKTWEWKNEYGGQIIRQFKKLGFSFDWERERFTMDKGYADAVLETFVRLFDKGYIYKGARVINWCPRCASAISDLEVEYQEQAGHFWHYRYPLEDGSGYVTIATTRPETMLGDTAVAVNSKDERYKALVGKNLILPLTDRVIPIVADDYVDMEFGTGCVKITPAHDPNDFELGLRHNLPQITVIAPDGRMTAVCGKYAGMDRYEAREAIVADLQALGLMDKIEDYTHQVGTCQRCGTTIEPLLSEQWFCRMKELAAPAIEAVKSGRITFWPKRYEKGYIEWLENVRDWCISRQLWWGHRIPVYKCSACGRFIASKTPVDVCPDCGGSTEQETDVLDTWFSSALWPFATLGWPEKTPELEYFFPTDVLITARDIINLWVARMIFSSLEYMDDIPFRDVYIYATVQDEKGRRMSKSLGTGVDPLEMIDLYGADALRYSLISQAGKTQDIRFSDKRVEIVSRFCNKIWNASRFVLMNIDGFRADDWSQVKDRLSAEDKWIISKLQKTARTANSSLATYDMDDAAKAIHDFIWNDYCDWYIELSKDRLRGSDGDVVRWTLGYVLEASLRLLHPVMPFITEEIWQYLNTEEGASIMLQPYPQADDSRIFEAAEQETELLMAIVGAIRSMRLQLDIPGAKPAKAVIVTGKDLSSMKDKIMFLGRLESLETPGGVTPEQKAAYAGTHLPGVDVYIDPEGLRDSGREKEKIARELSAIEKDLARAEGKLSNQGFLAKAPQEVIDKQKAVVSELSDKKAKLLERLALLG
ncbi:MAG: valine--tRNA ligase [Abditibacteriota bacterium]|nr:valine--tRNA ligase [Abditibacteriota bacterium]